MAQENSGPVFRKPPGAKVKFVQDSATEFKTTHLHKTRLLTFDLTFIVFCYSDTKKTPYHKQI